MKTEAQTQEPRVIAALGVFDGVHLGHRRVLAQAKALGACHVLTFAVETMPRKQGRPIRFLYDNAQRRCLLESCGAEAVFSLPFGEMQDMNGETFCREMLVERLHVHTVVCGMDFRFGKGASCGVDELARFGQHFGFHVKLVSQVKDKDGQVISTSHIRFLLESGEIMQANRLLGDDYRLFAPVVTGNQLGRQLGFPTANQAFASWQCVPCHGVYASFAAINDVWVPAITNIGTRPTVTGGTVPVAETHLLDWSGSLEGRRLPVTLRKFLRPEKKFASLEDLTAQIQRDVRQRLRMLEDSNGSA